MPKRFNEFISEMRTRPLTKKEKGKWFLRTPRQIPGPPGGHPVPPGYKRVHDVISGGTKLVKVSEGVGGVIRRVATAIAKDTTAHLPKTLEVERLTAKTAGELEDLGRATVAGATVVGGAAAAKKIKDLKNEKEKKKEKEKVAEGVIGAVLGGAAGLAAGGPIGALVGAAAGHKIQQRAATNVSFLDAAIANKVADVSDKRRAKKAAAAGQTRFRPSIVSRYMRNLAVRKSGGMYSVSPDATEPVSGIAPKKSTKKTTAAAPAPAPTPAPARAPSSAPTPAAAPAQNPEHTPGHPGHGVFPEPAHLTSAGKSLAIRRAAAQRAIAARIRAQEKNQKPKSSTIIIP